MAFTELNLAEQQLLGFSHAKKGYSLIELIDSMGLTEKEWSIIKDNHNHLTESETEEVNEYFLSQSKTSSKRWQE